MGVLGVGVVGHEVAGGEKCGEGRRTTRGETRERERKGWWRREKVRRGLLFCSWRCSLFSLSLPRLLPLAALLWPCLSSSLFFLGLVAQTPQGGKRRPDGKRRAGEQTLAKLWPVGGGEGEAAEAKGGRGTGSTCGSGLEWWCGQSSLLLVATRAIPGRNKNSVVKLAQRRKM